MLSSRRMFAVLILAAPVLISAVPHAKAAPPVAGSDAAAPANGVAGAPRRAAAGRRFVEKFEAANATHDGRLTRAQAEAGKMPAIVRNFASIDQGGRGYVTLPDIQAWRRQVRAERDSRQSAPNPAPARGPGQGSAADPDL